jgi:hypothetical protein
VAHRQFEHLAVARVETFGRGPDQLLRIRGVQGGAGIGRRGAHLSHLVQRHVPAASSQDP